GAGREQADADRMGADRRRKRRDQPGIVGGAEGGEGCKPAGEDRRDGGIRRHRHEAVGAEGCEGERAGGKGVEAGLGRHPRQPGGCQLPRNRDRSQHQAGEEIQRQPSDPIARQRCEQLGQHFRLRRYATLSAFFVRRWSPIFRSRAAAWYLRRISTMSTCVGGNFNPMSSIVSAMTCDTARLRNHLWFAGMMYQGARFVLVNAMASSYASTYCGHSSRSE